MHCASYLRGDNYKGSHFLALCFFCAYEQIVFGFFCLYGLFDKYVMCEGEFYDLYGND